MSIPGEVARLGRLHRIESRPAPMGELLQELQREAKGGGESPSCKCEILGRSLYNGLNARLQADEWLAPARSGETACL